MLQRVFGMYGLTLVLLLSVIVYHGLNLAHLSAYSIKPSSEDIHFMIRYQGKTLYQRKSKPWWGAAVTELGDFSVSWIKKVGYLGRFFARQGPDFSFYGPSRPHQRFYLREEIPFSYPEARAGLRKGADKIRNVIDTLAAHGVIVVVVPVPTKISIERAYLPSRLPSTFWWQPDPRVFDLKWETAYENYLAIMSGVEDHTINLFMAYRDYQVKDPKAEFYVPADSHWSSLGIAIAAREVIGTLARLDSGIRARATLSRVEEISTQGEFLDSYQINFPLVTQRPEFKWMESMYQLALSEKVSAIKRRLIVFGSSYGNRLRNSGYSLGEVLKNALQMELHDYSVGGGGSTAGFALSIKEGFRFRRGDVLVWEFPLRAAPSEVNFYPDLLFE